MKICQVNKKIFKILILSIFLLFFVFQSVLAAPGFQPLDVTGQGLTQDMLKPGYELQTIKVGDKVTQMVVEKSGVKRVMDQIQTWAKQEWKWVLEKGAAQAYKAALRNFLNSLAADTATYLATGDKGQSPMFETDNIGDYLLKTADNAAGTFLETLGKNGPIKFNLCKPDSSVMLKISLGLQKTARPSAPACTFSQMTSDWDKALKDKDFLPKFQDMFNPWSNDLGIALTLQTGMAESIKKEQDFKGLNYYINQGIHNVTDPISGKIKTPAWVVGTAAQKAYDDANANYKVYTGDAVADAISIFTNTLIGKLMDKWLKKGLVTNFPSKMSSLTDINAQNPSEGVTGAENRFRSLTEANFNVRGDYNILMELTACPDPNKAGPTNCVIDEKFREAIEKRLTVKQAMDQGYLNANGVFGFTSDGLEPRYNEGYPYRSMLILRKFRIIPVGWEIAAQKIKDEQNQVGGTKNLNDLVNCSAAWCIGLVDPNWVLKAEQNFCAKEGAGPEILSEQISGEGTASSLNILRNDTYCADEQSVIKQRNDGSNVYGYCTEERRIWDFNGKSCEPIDNTCQTFKLGENTFSYLQNTLDYGVCSAANAGCKKYATSGSYSITDKTITWNGNTDPVYLNKNAETCEAADEGCHGFIRILPGQNETYADIKTAGVETAYNRFSSTGLIYEKLLPDYLKSSCYSYDASGNILNGKLLSNAPDQCSDFVRQCKEEEAGCELYTNVTDSSKIPAKVGPNDYCPAECSGYNTFIQKETNFDLSRDAYFIPKTGKTCSAEAAGCDQFTNLDEVAKGGEGVEYYTYLRQCLKKSDNQGSCAEFYNWEGSDESGYQLKVDSLKADGTEPAVTKDDSALCTEEIYNLSPSNPAYKADCRQFYNRDGGISYHFYSLTVSCSDDCHPYRKTASGDSSESLCIGGGVWNDSEKACLYMAIPGQGATCSAAQSGCREYTGNTGNDIRNIFTDDFSDGTTGTWVGLNGSTISPSNESLTLGIDNKGHSIKITANAGGIAMAERQVGSAVTQGKSYVLSFLAKADSAADLNIGLVNSARANAAFAKVNLTTDWKIIQTNLAVLNHEATSSEVLRLSPVLPAGNIFYISNITLTEIVDRYYLIKNSWQTPASCDEEAPGVPHELFMLGCGQYTDRADKNYYLKSFSELCSESAVGCELMIDTHNSTATTTKTFVNSGTAKTVGADSFAYVVYDQNKLCNSQAKGCGLLGRSSVYDGATFYSDTYLKNDPDDYDTILCGVDAVGCQAFAYDGGEKYFKDPGDQVCEWRRQAGLGESQGWFKKKIKRCGGNGAVCLSDANCAGGAKCKLESADNVCPTSDSKTLGKGGAGGRVIQPGEANGFKWAGICAAANSGCGEYIDPSSKFNNNLIFNGSFIDLDNNASTIDGWEDGITQDVILEPNTVYRLARAVGAGSLTISSSVANSLYEINSNNELDGPKSSLSAPAGNSKIFYYKSNQEASCKITAGNTDGAVELKPVVIGYQLAQDLDFSSCNGVVDFNKGCVLFNQRIRDGASLKSLDWDADLTVDGAAPANGILADKDSNIILKVTPDRVCDKWLASRSYVKDEKDNNVVFDIGLCDALDENNNCSSFVSSSKTNQTIEALGADKISNLSGYAKVGINGGSLGGDYYPLGSMEQVGEVVNLVNGGFEYYGSNGYPIGWVWSGQEAANKSWDANIFSVINNPISAQVEGIGYAREGRSFLKLGSSYDATSEEVDVIPDTDYVITAYVNTKNLKSGQAIVDIVGVGAANKQNITQALGNDWQFKVGSFTTGAGVSRIKIKLYAAASGGGALTSSEGNFYFDDIKIRPALNSKDNWYTTQSCRLYPKSDSLSCDYYEDSGNRLKGWPGYCLEYDRAPGNSNACILWYPVDKVKGDGIEEGAGYLGKMPVYYCTNSVITINSPVESYDSQYYSGGKATNIFWANQAAHGNISGGFTVNYAKLVTPGGTYEIRNATGRGPTAKILENNADMLKIGGFADGFNSEGNYTFDLYDSTSDEKVFSWQGNVDITLDIIFTRIDVYCSQIAKTVTEVGQNKYWSSRVYLGSDHKFTCQAFNDSFSLSYANTAKFGFVDSVCEYGTNAAPFGSIAAPSNNPYEWDSSSIVGIQPLSYISIKGGSVIERLQNQTDIKHLFAQSYGAWRWVGDGANGRYTPDDSLNWPLPDCLCGGGCDANFCAHLPTVSNVKINSSGSDVNLTKNGFINLTFNTKADSNQLPLVMYAVDWGDGEKTTVTGVEMRDRPNPDVPHSMYHLYSYWDLKAKANQGKLTNGSYCNTAGSCFIKPRVQIKDNWGWCNHGAAINTCGAGQWDNFGGWVVVKEK